MSHSDTNHHEDQQGDLFDRAPDPDALELSEAEKFIVDVEGFEGPLDLLLMLARSQKVDLTKISILELAQQYLLFISEARKYRLELAADYLVMAAWLAFLKSKLLLPEEEKTAEEGPTGEELAALLAFRLQKLSAMREAASQIMARKILGIDFFARGMPENVRVIKAPEYKADIYDLLKAYAFQRQRTSVRTVHVGGRQVWSIREARDRLERLMGVSIEWCSIDQFLQDIKGNEEDRRTVTASTFGATLELVREGELELKQTEPFAPIYLRKVMSTKVASPDAQQSTPHSNKTDNPV